MHSCTHDDELGSSPHLELYFRPSSRSTMPRAVFAAPEREPVAMWLPPAASDVLQGWVPADITAFEALHEEFATDRCKRGPLGEAAFARHLSGIPRAVRLAYALPRQVAPHHERQVCDRIEQLLCEATCFWASVDEEIPNEL